MSTKEKSSSIIILNDQGGARMGISYDVTGTLRAQDHAHPPLIFDARGNGGDLYARQSREITTHI